jgi:hypothetical protein
MCSEKGGGKKKTKRRLNAIKEGWKLQGSAAEKYVELG